MYFETVLNLTLFVIPLLSARIFTVFGKFIRGQSVTQRTLVAKLLGTHLSI